MLRYTKLDKRSLLDFLLNNNFSTPFSVKKNSFNIGYIVF